MPETAWLKAPQQPRSEETLRRILEAAYELMDEGYFERATITEIVRRAGTSVGAFYTRFKDKEALFHVLHQQVLGELEAAITELTDAEGRANAPLREAIPRMIQRLLDLYRARPGVLRAMSLYARGNPDPVFADRAVRVNRLAFERVHAVLIRRASEIAHPNPSVAIRVGLAMISSTTRELTLFGDAGLTPIGLDYDELSRELSEAWLSYLENSATTMGSPS